MNEIVKYEKFENFAKSKKMILDQAMRGLDDSLYSIYKQGDHQKCKPDKSRYIILTMKNKHTFTQITIFTVLLTSMQFCLSDKLNADTVLENSSENSLCQTNENAINYKIRCDNLDGLKLTFKDTETEYANIKKCLELVIENEKSLDKNLFMDELLKQMVKVDQFILKTQHLPEENYSSIEDKNNIIAKLKKEADTQQKFHTDKLKEVIKRYGWPKISEAGELADQNAWLIVQHSDYDVAFQKEALSILEKLLEKGDTSKSNFAYLYDRVAVNENRLQKFGTQGGCIGKGKWEPRPVENPELLDKLRAEMGLEPMEDYKKRFKDICQ